MTSDELAAKLSPCFTTRPAGEGPDAAATVWEDIETGGEQGAIGLYTQKDGRWLIATLTDAGKARMAEVAKDHTEAWQSLGVSLLHRLIIDDLLGCKELPKPSYVHLIEEVTEGLQDGRVSAGRRRHAGHGRRRSHDQHGRRTDAGQEHLLLSEAAQRAGDQSAGVEPWPRETRLRPAIPRETGQDAARRST